MDRPAGKPGPGIRILASGLLGLGALALVLGVLIATKDHQDVRPVVVVAYLAFFGAGLCSPAGAARLNWAGGMTVALAGIAPVLALSYLRLAMTDHIFLAIYILVALTGVLSAIAVRRLGAAGRPGYAVALAVVALLAAGGVAFAVMPAVVERLAYVAADRTVTPFSVRTLDGAPISSQSWRGRVVVLSYWATWCPPCQAEMPQIAALQRKYAGDPRVVIIALNAAYAGDTADKAKAFLQRRNIAGAQAIDDVKAPGKHAGEAAGSLGLKVVPTLFILDRAGKLVAVHTGYDGAEHLVTTLSEHIDGLLAHG
ncbi:MAG TPA: TlpA disulfide reductase family protein [Phenylobacterium sp.]|nr:TlpA disulfide reductase family protein [Phenylobacterium sp.]